VELLHEGSNLRHERMSRCRIARFQCSANVSPKLVQLRHESIFVRKSRLKRRCIVSRKLRKEDLETRIDKDIARGVVQNAMNAIAMMSSIARIAITRATPMLSKHRTSSCYKQHENEKSLDILHIHNYVY
jgi:hypothetical protein